MKSLEASTQNNSTTSKHVANTAGQLSNQSKHVTQIIQDLNAAIGKSGISPMTSNPNSAESSYDGVLKSAA